MSQHTAYPSAALVHHDQHTGPIPDNLMDAELQAEPSIPHPEAVYVKVTYDWSGPKGVRSNQWRPHMLVFDRTTFYEEVIDEIAEYIHHKLRYLEPEASEWLDRSKSCVVLQPILSKFTLERHANRTKANRKLWAETIQDLCEHDLTMNFNISLERKQRNQHDVISSQGMGRMVKIQTRDNAQPGFRYHYIGFIPSILGQEEERTAEVLQPSQQDLKSDVHMWVFFWRWSLDPTQMPDLIRTPAWRLALREICDPDKGVRVSTDTELLTKLALCDAYRELVVKEGAKKFYDTLDAFQKWRSDSSLKPHEFCRYSQLTYKLQDPAGTNVVALSSPVDTNKPIPTTLHFVQRLETTRDSKIGLVPKTTVLRPNINYVGLRRKMLRSLKDMSGTSPLFEHPHKAGLTWDVEFWIKPQVEKHLFEFTPDSDLRRFLDPSQVREGDRSLYMQVHIVHLDGDVDDRHGLGSRSPEDGQKDESSGLSDPPSDLDSRVMFSWETSVNTHEATAEKTARTKSSKQASKLTSKQRKMGFFAVKDVLRERVVGGGIEYLVDWEDNVQTGETYTPTWQPRKFLNKRLLADWEAKKLAQGAGAS